MPDTSSNIYRVPLVRCVIAASLMSLLSACGGSSDDNSSGTSQSAAESKSSTSLSSGTSVSSSVDAVYDTTTKLAASGKSASGARASTLSDSRAKATTSDAVTFTLPCDSDGTATVTVSGADDESPLNGRLDAGEHYEVTFAACQTEGGHVQLDGSVAMDVESITTAATTVSMTFSSLKSTVDNATATLNGTATVEHGSTTSDYATVTESQVTAEKLSLSTTANSRSASLTLTDVDITHEITWSGSVPSSSTLEGRFAVSGTADGQDFSDNVSITSEVSFDASGDPTSGSWTSINSNATVATTASDGKVTIAVDDGNDGTTDHTWTVTVQDWLSSAF